MRKFAAMGGLILALSVGAVSPVGAAGPVARTSASSVRVVATSHVWNASAKTGTLSATSRIVITSTYSSGRVSVTSRGVKKGDKLHVWMSARKGTGKMTVIASVQVTVTTSSGKATFSFGLTRAQAMRIKALIAAGDTLTFHLTDGLKSTSAKYVKG
jgi:hypothetical protein